MAYVRHIIRLVRQAGAEIVLLLQPIPREHVQRIWNYDDVALSVASLARSEGVEFLDFNRLIDLGDESNYYDADHLTQSGVVAFNLALLRELRMRGLLAGPSAVQQQ